MADDKKPRFRRGPFGEAIFPGAEPDLTMETMVRYRTKATVREIARFYEAVYGDERPHMQLDLSKDGDETLFVLGVGPKYKGESRIGAIAVMIDPKTKKKRKQHTHIVVTSRSGYDD